MVLTKDKITSPYSSNFSSKLENKNEVLEKKGKGKKKEKEKGKEEDKSSKIFIYGNKFWTNTKLPSKSADCLLLIEKYYTAEKIDEIIYPLLNKKFDISARTLEFTCVNYAKNKNVMYPWIINDEKIIIHLGNLYDRWLDHWNRPNFDFFKRYTRVYFKHKGEILKSTVGQLHFLYWADIHGVICYIKNNLQEITKEMREVHRENRKEKRAYKLSGQKRKRKRLVNTPNGSCFIYNVDNFVLKFNDDSEEINDSEEEK